MIHQVHQWCQQKHAAEKEEEKERKGGRGKRKEQEEGKIEKGREVEEEKDKEVEKDVMDWTLVTRSTKQRRRMVQIFFNADGSRTIMMEMALSDKVSDIVKRIPTSACCNKSDVYVKCEQKVLRRGEELRRCGLIEGSACSGGEQDARWRKTQGRETKRDQSEEEPESDRSPAIHEEEVIQQFGENEGYRELVACVAEGNDLTALQEWSGLDKGQVENIDRGIRRVVEARRRATGRERTAEQEQGKQVRFAGEEQSVEKRAQSTDKQDVMDGFEEAKTERQRRHRKPWKQSEKRKQRNAPGHEHDEM